MLRQIFIQNSFRKFSTKIDKRQAELMARSLPKKSPLPGVKDIIIVASGKGGVGKSTTAVNLSVTLAKLNKNVGLLDADIFGPSIPLMMNISEEPLVNDKNHMIPPINYGVKCISMGLLLASQQNTGGGGGGPIIWRGPLVMSAIERLLKGTVWKPLDILIIDTPPGTGDIHLSLAQNIPISGVLLVSTPQVAALNITQKGAEMYKKFNSPIIGLIENMQNILCTNCKHKIEIFKNVTKKYTDKMNTDILISVPLDDMVSECCDIGIPYTIKYPDSEYSRLFKELSLKIIKYLDNKS